MPKALRVVLTIAGIVAVPVMGSFVQLLTGTFWPTGWGMVLTLIGGLYVWRLTGLAKPRA